MQTKVKFVLLQLLAFVWCCTLHAQDTTAIPAEANTAKEPITTIEFEEEVYDFGTIESGDVVTKVFTFTNTGDEMLLLTNAKGSCGCTVPQWPKEPLAPGETASITVEFNSKNKSGMQSKIVTITANTEPALSRLNIKGEVLKNTNTEEIEMPEEELTIHPDCFAIYPNPTAEILKLDVEETSFGKTAEVSILSKTGQLMAKRSIDNIEGIIEFNVGHYPAGTYVARLQIDKQKPESRCFVVVH